MSIWFATPEWEHIFSMYTIYPAYSTVSVDKVVAIRDGDTNKSWLGIFKTKDCRYLFLRGNILKPLCKPISSGIVRETLPATLNTLLDEEKAILFSQINSYLDS